MMHTHTEKQIRRHNRAEDIAFSSVDFMLQYIAEAYGDEPVEVQQRAIFIAAHMLAPLAQGKMYN